MRILNLFLILFFTLIFCLNSGFSSLYISEIKFNGDEFVEIYSSLELNLSNSLVIDESGKNNSLKLFNFVNNSNYYLVVGNNFISNFKGDLNDLNCSIYVTDKSQVSNGGLKSSGENFFIGNLSFNLSGNKYDFEEDESLNFVNETFGVQSSSVCKENEVFEIDEIIEVPNENLNESISCGNYNFEVILKDEKIIFEDIVKFKFESNYSEKFGDFLINYWIEDYNSNIVKSIKNTTNLNWKQFSPSGSTAIYQVFGELRFANCSLNNSKYFSFYSDYVETETKIKYVESSEDKNKEELTNEHYIKLLNIEKVLIGESEYLEYEVYRGDSSKYVVNFYLDSKNILKLNLKKFENYTGKVFVGFDGFEKLKVKGFGFDEIYNLSKKQQKNIEMTKKINQFFELSGVRQVDNKLFFKIDSNIENLTNECYISKVRTKVSLVLIDRIGNLSLEIKTSKLNDGDLLKLTCKFKKKNLKTWNYETQEFNFSKDYIIKILNLTFDVYKRQKTEIVEKENKFTESELGLVNSFDKIIYRDKNLDYLNLTKDFVFYGSVILISSLILIW